MKLSIQALFFSITLLGSVAAAPQESAELSPPICPMCKPLPGENKCDITTSCIGVYEYGWPYYCACRHGYRADYVHPDDTDVQFRLNFPGQEGRVFVKPGTACNTLCDHWELGKDGCQEVPIRSECRY